MTGAQKIEFVRGQIAKLRAGKSDSLKCPYCDGENISQEEDTFCCLNFAEATAAILHREGVQKLMDQAARIADKANRN